MSDRDVERKNQAIASIEREIAALEKDLQPVRERYEETVQRRTAEDVQEQIRTVLVSDYGVPADKAGQWAEVVTDVADCDDDGIVRDQHISAALRVLGWKGTA